MDRLNGILFVLLGVVSCVHVSITLLVMEETAGPGDNITLYCDCKVSTGVYIVWFRNCSHQNQPTLLLHLKEFHVWDKRFPRFKYEKNDSSDSYDLVIINTTESDEGLYYCGTEEKKVEKENDKIIISKDIYRYSNITTRLTVNPGLPPDVKQPLQECEVYRKLLFFLSPAVSLLFTLLFSGLIYLLCQKTADERTHEETKEVHQASSSPIKRPKKKRTFQSSDFNTYSTVRYISNVGI
ncbi:uncharacterized protein LOC108241526 isoform X2 [Kryptolebias marmoratus]|uniref:uncharacterized protein LOC108241526 isoform X2 n=1 Tax=Kryptolebias marmoratus TaxID=37003 RepID=UPI0018ACA555|nr:uncharacterized protein LOC108241526 isoform X2 [Kryptolebias marmoratus]